MDKKRIEKEIKKAQKKGIYNPKLKLGIIGLILTIGTIIGTSYAYYTETANNTLTITGTISKKIKVTVSATNGTVTGSPKTVDYNTQATFTVTPSSGYKYKDVTCNDSSNQDVTSTDNATYSNNTLTVTPKTSKDVTCTVTFEEEEKVTIFEKEYTVKTETPDFSKGCPTNGDTSCSGLYKMTDYKNTSSSLNYDHPGGESYYFRGKVENNYVKFANKDWRIVRVNGDGTIRLVLDGDIGASTFNSSNNQRKYVGYTYGNNSPCTNNNPCTSNYSNSQFSSTNIGTNSTIKSKLEEWYKTNLATYDSKIALTTFCNDTSYGSGDETGDLYYGPYERLWNSSPVKPQLTCPDPKTNYPISTPSESSEYTGMYRTYGGVYKLKIGLLSADEIVLAGFKPTNSSGVTTDNYLYYTNPSDPIFWSSSPVNSDAYHASVFDGYLGSRHLNSNSVNVTNGARPVINLNSSVTVSGNGSKDCPFSILVPGHQTEQCAKPTY